MNTGLALVADQIHDGRSLNGSGAVLVRNGQIVSVVEHDKVPDDWTVRKFGAGILAPGFVDLQVNGGGGVMFNDARSVDGLRRIAEAHAATGTAAILPTLITAAPSVVTEAIAAAIAAVDAGVPGIAGLHLEGPHLSVARKGAHNPDLIRPMTGADLKQLVDAAGRLPNLMVTVAAETVSPEQVGELVAAGVIVSIGHSDANHEQVRRAVDAGSTCATHLFNAMSPVTSREPGLVGTVLDAPELHCGLIADGFHVHPATMAVALRAKRGPGSVFLVTDAMSSVGSDITELFLDGRRILRQDGRLTLEDGSLAGADVTIPREIQILTEQVGVSLEVAISMATGTPAAVLHSAGGLGSLQSGAPARLVHIAPDLQCTPVVA